MSVGRLQMHSPYNILAYPEPHESVDVTLFLVLVCECRKENISLFLARRDVVAHQEEECR